MRALWIKVIAAAVFASLALGCAAPAQGPPANQRKSARPAPVEPMARAGFTTDDRIRMMYTREGRLARGLVEVDSLGEAASRVGYEAILPTETVGRRLVGLFYGLSKDPETRKELNYKGRFVAVYSGQLTLEAYPGGPRGSESFLAQRDAIGRAKVETLEGVPVVVREPATRTESNGATWHEPGMVKWFVGDGDYVWVVFAEEAPVSEMKLVAASIIRQQKALR